MHQNSNLYANLVETKKGTLIFCKVFETYFFIHIYKHWQVHENKPKESKNVLS